MDGYAVRTKDLKGAREGSPIELKVEGDLGPGHPSKISVGPGKAVRVATGAPIPEGTDTVIPIEELEEVQGRISVGFVPEAGRFVYPMGADIHAGEIVVRAGQVIRAQDVGLLLATGIERMKVFAKPRVAVLATGSELTNQRPGPKEVRNSHSPIFLKLVEEMGCTPVDLGIAKDRPLEVARKIKVGLGRSELVITLGGTSVGRHDLVGEAVSSMKPELEVHGIRMDRGRVTGAAVVKGRPILMIPGPLQGAMNAFFILGIPIMNALSGRKVSLPRVSCVLGKDWRARPRFSHFIKVVYVALKDGGVAEPILGETESITILTRADGLVVVPEDVASLSKGSVVEVVLLPGFTFA